MKVGRFHCLLVTAGFLVTLLSVSSTTTGASAEPASVRQGSPAQLVQTNVLGVPGPVLAAPRHQSWLVPRGIIPLAQVGVIEPPLDVVVTALSSFSVPPVVGPLAQAIPPSSGTFDVLNTLAGTSLSLNAVDGYGGDGGPAVLARLSGPKGVHVMASGVILIADDNNKRVRKIALDGMISTIAGTGQLGVDNGTNGDEGLATAATFERVMGVDSDSLGRIYINENNRIRRIGVDGVIRNFAGRNLGCGFGGDSGPALQATLCFPHGMLVAPDGRVFFSDQGSDRVRVVNSAGIISTYAGSNFCCAGGGFSGDGGPAISAQLNHPTGLAMDAAGNLFIADSNNRRIRRVSASGIITTFAGTGTCGFSGDGGAATLAQLCNLEGLEVDLGGRLLIVDGDSGDAASNRRIRRVDISGVISTVVGNGSFGFDGNGRPALSSALSPYDIDFDLAGNLLIASNAISRVLRMSSVSIASRTGMGPTGSSARKPFQRERADPVNTTTGSFVVSTNDLAISGRGVTFDFRRSYDSRNPGSSRLGVGWGDLYDQRVSVDASGTALWTPGTGEVVAFPSDGSGGFVSPAGVLAKLVPAPGGGWDLTERSDTTFRFDANGRLLTARDRSGQGSELVKGFGASWLVRRFG